MILTFIQGHSCIINEKNWCPFSQKFLSGFGCNLWCCHSLLVLLKLIQNLVCSSSIQGREHCWQYFIKYMISIVLSPGTCKLICFKLGVMLDMTKLYSWIPAWMVLMFTQGHKVSHSVEKLHEPTQIFLIVDYVRRSYMKQLGCSWGLIM